MSDGQHKPSDTSKPHRSESSLDRDKARLSKLSTENKVLKAENERLKDSSKLNADYKNLKIEHENLKADHTKTLKGVDTINAENARLKKEISELKNAIEALKDDFLKQVNDVKENFKVQTHQYNRHVDILTKENMSLKQNLRDLENKTTVTNYSPPENPKKRRNIGNSPPMLPPPPEDDASNMQVNFPPLPPREAQQPVNNVPSAPSYAQAAKMPPIILGSKDGWTEIRKKLRNKNISFDRATVTTQGIKIIPKNPSDYRQITAELKNENRAFHSFTLPEDRLIYSVIRGIPIDIELADIKEALNEQGIDDVLHVSRMGHPRTKNKMPLILVKTKSDNIRKINRLLDLVISIEEKRRYPQPGQCHRCQRFGHSQSGCNHPPRCVKCGKDHMTIDCTLQKPNEGFNATCANCGQAGHPASFRGCDTYRRYIGKNTKDASAARNANNENVNIVNRNPPQRAISPPPSAQLRSVTFDPRTRAPQPPPSDWKSSMQKTMEDFLGLFRRQMEQIIMENLNNF